jgi:hypothetical protein
MKKPSLYWVAIIAAACQSQPDAATQQAEPTAKPTNSLPQAATVAQQLSPILSGYWLSSAYLDKLAQTRSPAATFDYTPDGPASIYIEPFASQQDSVQISASYGMHEGGDLMMLLPQPITDNTVPLKRQYGAQPGITEHLTYHLSQTDTTLSFTERRLKGKSVTNNIAYRRVVPAGVKTDLDGGVEWGVNKLLIAGDYRGTDSLQHAVSAQFLANGTVKGLPFRKYLIQTDFTGPNGGDEVIFDVYTKSQLNMAASFGRDTLRLYSMRSGLETRPGTMDTMEVFRRGHLRYELVRQR